MSILIHEHFESASHRHVGWCVLRHTSRDHLALHLALPNRVLVGGPYGVLIPPHPTCTSLECWACSLQVSWSIRKMCLVWVLLRCDFAVRSESNGCSGASLPRKRVPLPRLFAERNRRVRDKPSSLLFQLQNE